jgi:sigma-B regulation protein RsbU (phosphoserine phosphatase)
MSGPALLRLDLPAKAETLADLRVALRAAFARADISPAASERLVLAINEAVCNVIRHGYAGRDDGALHLRIERARGVLRMRLRDAAPPVDPSTIKPRDLDECRPGGLGINFIDATMDSWRLRPLRSRDGNVLTMRKRLRDVRLRSKRHQGKP